MRYSIVTLLMFAGLNASAAHAEIPLPQEIGEKLVCDVTAKSYCGPRGDCQIPGNLTGRQEIAEVIGKEGPFGWGGPRLRILMDRENFKIDIKTESRSQERVSLQGGHFNWNSLGTDSAALTLNSDGTGEVIVLLNGMGLIINTDYLLSECSVQ